MIALEGIGLSPGTARGAAVMLRPAPVESGSDADRSSQEQFRMARCRAEATLSRALEAMPAEGPARQILRAHLLLLADPMLAEQVEARIVGDRISASAALERAAAALSARFAALADPVMRQRAADVRDVCECIAAHLGGGASRLRVGESGIVCATDLSPAQVLQISQARPLAFVLEQGARTSHAAMLIRALAVPAVIGVPGATSLVHDGDLVFVDADRGQVLVHPDPDLPCPAVAASSIDRSDPHPALTRDGAAIAISATIADASDAARAVAAGADGIGLWRTEFLFLGGDRLPSEDVHEAACREIGEAIGSRPLTVRLLDLGADKALHALQLADASNPLGLRGVRLLLAQPELLRDQLRALLRAAASRRMRLLLPMVVDPTDIARVRDAIDETSHDLGREARAIEIGVMIETPAAGLMAEELAAAADFLSIGTNDLAQYVLAADRHSSAMAPFYDPLHPAVLRLVRNVVAAATRRQTPVSACGEAAADPRAVPLFVGMGVTELSVRPSAVVGVKAQVRRIDATAARALADEVVTFATAGAVTARIDAAGESATGIDVHEARRPR